MPAVREPSDGPTPLEVVEVRPGVRLKLNATDKKAVLAAQSAAAEQQRAWNLVNAGVTDKTAKETPIAGPAVDGPPDDAEPATADAEEATVTAAPKPRTRRKTSK